MEYKTVFELTQDDRHFGWKFVEQKSVRHGRVRRQAYVLGRNQEMPNYRQLVNYEEKYYQLKGQLTKHEPFDFGICFLLLLIFIIPGVLYIVIKIVQHRNDKRKFEEIQDQLTNIRKAVMEIYNPDK